MWHFLADYSQTFLTNFEEKNDEKSVLVIFKLIQSKTQNKSLLKDENKRKEISRRPMTFDLWTLNFEF